MFGIWRLRWALRKLKLPVGRDDLVLDVGSGGTPYPRADVLLDRLTGSEHRNGEPMQIDRLAVFGDAQQMPFKDKSFDFIVASHILEHMSDPEKFLLELQRVGKAGYIETPNALFERLIPYDIHCLEIMDVEGTMYIHKKEKPQEDDFLGPLKFIEKNAQWKNLFFQRLDMFHVRIFWEEAINFVVTNPQTSCDWIEDINLNSSVGDNKKSYLGSKWSWRRGGLVLANYCFSRRRMRRLKNFRLKDILCCPVCYGDLISERDALVCAKCEKEYSREPALDFTRAQDLKLNNDA